MAVLKAMLVKLITIQLQRPGDCDFKPDSKFRLVLPHFLDLISKDISMVLEAPMNPPQTQSQLH